MKILITSVLVVLAVAFTAFNSSIALGEESANIKEVTLKVDGMTCSMCPLTIKTALKKLDGVTDADVSYRDSEAKVRYEEGKVTVDEIVKAIENAGNYKASVITRESSPDT